METKYMNPYLAGFLLGLLLVATVYITGRGLGASGAIKSFTVEAVTSIAPAHAENSKFYEEYIKAHASALKSWLVFEVVGVLIGAFISGLVSDRLNFNLEHGPNIGSKVRIFGAITGGLLFGFGAQLGRGCTSGAALSGMAVLSDRWNYNNACHLWGRLFLCVFFQKTWL